MKKVLAIPMFVLMFAATAHAAPADGTAQGMTLWQTLVAGGWVMIVIGLLSIFAVAIIAYDIMTLNTDKLTPRKFYDEIMAKLDAKDITGVRAACVREGNNIIARVVLAGLDKAQKGAVEMKDAMEHRARTEIAALWQNLNYLSDIITVAPLLGLLGTVLGMIEAFHAVPLQTGGAKTAMLSGGISKAMVTTAAGLIVAVPVVMAYSYFRGKVQEVTSAVEVYITDITKKMERI